MINIEKLGANLTRNLKQIEKRRKEREEDKNVVFVMIVKQLVN